MTRDRSPLGPSGRPILTNLLLGVAVGGLLASCDAGTEPAAPARAVATRGTAEDPPARAVEVTAGDPLVLFLGDSLAAGLHLPAEDAFPAVLQRRLAAAGLPFRLQNAGVSGDTTAGGLSRLDWLLRQDPDLMVLELGNNDGLRGLPLETVEANLRGILARAREAELPVLLLGVVLPTNYGDDYRDGFAAIYDRLAEELELDYVPYFVEGVGGIPEMNLRDGLHPTTEGHERLADNIEPALRAMLERHEAAESVE